jgi:hypothetical protein
MLRTNDWRAIDAAQAAEIWDTAAFLRNANKVRSFNHLSRVREIE